MGLVRQLIALTAGLAIGAIAMLLAITHVKGLGHGDWLQFLGGLLGVSLAVFGAIYVEDWKQDRQNREQRALLQKAIYELGGALYAAMDVEIIESVLYPPDERVQNLMLNAFYRLETVHELLFSIRKSTKIGEIGIWQKLYALERAIRDALPLIKAEVEHLPKIDKGPYEKSPLVNFASRHYEQVYDLQRSLG